VYVFVCVCVCVCVCVPGDHFSSTVEVHEINFFFMDFYGSFFFSWTSTVYVCVCACLYVAGATRQHGPRQGGPGAGTGRGPPCTVYA
jgi:hypothetical protein